jgi:U3 small nucleolar RNA-associated protein 18
MDKETLKFSKKSKINKKIKNKTSEEEKNQKQETAEQWVDKEDELIKINLNSKNNLKKLKKSINEDMISGAEFQNRLRQQFSNMNAKSEIYKWALTSDKGESTSEGTESNSLENLLKTNKPIASGGDSEENILKIKQLQDATKENLHSSIISSLEFSSREENLLFTTGLDKKLKIFQISEEGISNNIETITLQDMPIFSAKFLNSSQEIILSGRRQHFYLYNLEKNKLERNNGLFSHHKEVHSLEKLFTNPYSEYFAFGTVDGYILIYDSRNKTYRYDLKINGSVNSVCFDTNGVNLFAVGDQSEIYVFDLRKYRNCVNKTSDVGNFNTNYMDLSRDNRFLATGK